MDLSKMDTWLAPFNGLWQDLTPIFPKLVAALALLLLGLLASMAARGLALAIARFLGFDQRFENLWLFRIWSRRHHGLSPSQGLSRMAFNAGIFVTAILAIHTLANPGQSGAFASLLSIVPRVLSVVLILLLSGFLASFVSFLVQMVLTGSELPHSVFWGKVAAWTTFGAGVMFSLEPLGLAGQILGDALLILLSGLALALGLAFGLGCKDLAREFLLQLIAEDKGA